MKYEYDVNVHHTIYKMFLNLNSGLENRECGRRDPSGCPRGTLHR
jgi:hypothetical protein